MGYLPAYLPAFKYLQLNFLISSHFLYECPGRSFAREIYTVMLDLCESCETRKPIDPFASLLRVLIPQIFCNGMSIAKNRSKYISLSLRRKQKRKHKQNVTTTPRYSWKINSHRHAMRRRSALL